MSWGDYALGKASCFAVSALSDILSFLVTTFSLYSPLFSFSVWEGDRMCGWSIVYNSLTHCSYIFPLQLHRTASSKYVLPLACSALSFFCLHLQTGRLWDINELFTCISTVVPLKRSNEWMAVMREKIYVNICCIWDFWNFTSWIFFQIFRFNVKSWECWKGFNCLEQLKGKRLNHVISSHLKGPHELQQAKFRSARIWYVPSFCTFNTFGNQSHLMAKPYQSGTA